MVGVYRFLLQVLHEEMQFSHPTALSEGQTWHMHQNSSNYSKLYYQVKYLIEVNTFFLSISFYYQSCTISLHLIIAISFDLISPFVSNGFPSLWQRHKFPSLVFMQGFNFFLHCCHRQRSILAINSLFGKLMALNPLLEDNIQCCLPNIL